MPNWDDALLWVDDRRDCGEHRILALAPQTAILHYVAFVDRGDVRRVISLRRERGTSAGALLPTAMASAAHRWPIVASEPSGTDTVRTAPTSPRPVSLGWRFPLHSTYC